MGHNVMEVGYNVWKWVIMSGSGLLCLEVGHNVWKWVIMSGSGL